MHRQALAFRFSYAAGLPPFCSQTLNHKELCNLLERNKITSIHTKYSYKQSDEMHTSTPLITIMPGKTYPSIPPVFPIDPAQHPSHSISMATTGEHEADLDTYVKEAFIQSDALYSDHMSRPRRMNRRLRTSLMMVTSVTVTVHRSPHHGIEPVTSASPAQIQHTTSISLLKTKTFPCHH